MQSRPSRFLAARKEALALCLCVAAGVPALAANPDWTALDDETAKNPMKVREIAERYVAQYHQSGDRKQELEALSVSVDANLILNDYVKARAMVERGLPLAQELNESRLLVNLTWSRGQIRMDQGDLVGAVYDFGEAAKLARQVGMEEERAGILIDQARVLNKQSRYNEALPLLFDAHAAFERLHKKQGIGVTLGVLADTYSQLGDYTQSLEYLRRAMAGLDEEKDAFELATVRFNMAASLMALNRLDEAEHLLTAALAKALKGNDANSTAFIRYRLGVIAEKRGWDKTALAYFDSALPQFIRTDDIAMVMHTQLDRAPLLAKTDTASAMQAFDEARLLLNRLNTPDEQMAVHYAGSAMYKNMGRYKEALTELEAWKTAKELDYSQFNRKAVTEMQVRFDAKQKEIENALLKSEQQRQAAELHASSNGRWLLLIGLSCSVVLLGTAISLLVYQMRQKRRYADLALHDELTSAPNRRHILAYAQRQLEACRSVGNDYSLAIIDLDNFKTINDRCGHDMGDLVLKAFAIACQGELRRGDRLGRMGGEEWLLVMPTAKQDELTVVFERLRATYQSHRPPQLAADLALTFSMGAAQAQAGESFERLLARADAAMYQAKQTGRDRLVLAERPPIPLSAFEPDG